MDENRKETADALAKFVPSVIVTHPLGPLDNLALYRQIGRAFGKEPEAELLCDRFDVAFRTVQSKKFERKKVLYLIWKDPWMTVSRDTYISRTLALFGLETVPESAEARYPALADLSPHEAEIILLSTEPYRFNDGHKDELRKQLGLPVLLIDGEMTSWYGPRAIAGLDYLADFAKAL